MQISLQSAETQNSLGQSVSIPKPEDTIQDYTLHQVYGTLFFNSGGGSITFHSFPLSLSSRPATTGQVDLTIPLTVYQLRQIEEQRVGDVTLTFNFTFEFAKHWPIRRDQFQSPIEKFETNFLSMTVTIPWSQWVDKVLPGLGYGKIHLVEVPLPETAIGEVLAKAVAEFQKAQSDMLQGDYDKVLGHCRNALELLSNARKYEGDKANPSFADKIDYLLETLPGTPTGMRRENLARMLKDLWGFTSPPQHPSPPYFSRDDAEMTRLITIAVLAYVGHFLSRANER